MMLNDEGQVRQATPPPYSPDGDGDGDDWLEAKTEMMLDNNDRTGMRKTMTTHHHQGDDMGK